LHSQTPQPPPPSPRRRLSGRLAPRGAPTLGRVHNSFLRLTEKGDADSAHGSSHQNNHDRRSRRKSGSRRRGHHGAHETLDGIKHPPLQYPDLSDELVRLRPLADTDADALVKACADPLIPKFTYWPNALSKEDARERVHHAEEWRTAGTRLELAVADTASDALIGFIGLAPAWQERRASVFYWTAPWARERGVARRALKLLVHWAFDELSIERLELEADADNIASQRVAEAVGFERERVLRAHRLRADGRCDSIIYSLAA
jgi:RimJ/RimL family protein N-acetyltransferase